MKHFPPILALPAVLLIASCATTIGGDFRGQPLEAYGPSEKLLVGVLRPVDATAELADRLDGSTGILISELQKYGRIRVVEKERVDALIREHEFGLSGIVDSASAAEIGKLLGVDALCFATVSSLAYEEKRTSALVAWFDDQTADLVMDARIVDVETGEVLATTNVSVTSGRRQWIALGFLKMGARTDKAEVLRTALLEAVQAAAYRLSESMPRK